MSRSQYLEIKLGKDESGVISPIGRGMMMVYTDIYTYLWSVWGGVWEEWLCRRDKQASPESPAWEELEEPERSGCTAQQQQPWPGRWAESSALQMAAGRGRDRE